MNYKVFAPHDCHIEVELPASKSISNRALVINALCDDSIPITNVSDCDDTRVMKQAFTKKNSSIDIHGAGTAMRFLTAYYAQKRDYECIISGSERMKQRPIKILVDALRSLGADIRYVDKEGFPPLQIFGKELRGGELSLPGNVSSQYISALLMIAPYMQNGFYALYRNDSRNDVSFRYRDTPLQQYHTSSGRPILPEAIPNRTGLVGGFLLV